MSGLVAISSSLLSAKTSVDATWLEVVRKPTKLEALQAHAACGPADEPVEDVNRLEGATYALHLPNTLQQHIIRLIQASSGKLVTVSIDPPNSADEESAST